MDKGTLVAELEGHKAQVKSLSFSPDGKILASASWDHIIRLWDVKKHELIRQISTIGDLVAFSPGRQEVGLRRHGRHGGSVLGPEHRASKSWRSTTAPTEPIPLASPRMVRG